MEKDILSLFVTNEITASLITKLYRWALVLLLLSIAYWVLNFVDFYIVLARAPGAIKNDPAKFYLYKLYPVISGIGMTLSIIGSILNYKGYGHISAGIKLSDSILLNKGFKNFCTTYLLGFISYSISIIFIVYKLLK